MAPAQRKTDRDSRPRGFDMSALLRLAVWGGAATAALAIAVLSTQTSVGSQRLTGALASASGRDTAAQPPAPAVNARLAAQAAELENETRRLAVAVRSLAADRERLLTRVAALERNLEDATGSIRRQAASAATESAPALPVPATTTIAATPPARATAPRTPAPPEADGEEDRSQAVTGTQIATAPATEAAAPEPTKPKLEYGVDIGGAVNFEGLRVLWNSTRNANAALVEGLQPVFVTRETNTRGVNLRLILGPLPTTEAATRLCAILMAAHRYCQMTTFEGQQLSLAEPPRPAAAPPARSPAPKARPPAKSNP